MSAIAATLAALSLAGGHAVHHQHASAHKTANVPCLVRAYDARRRNRRALKDGVCLPARFDHA